MSDEIKEVVQDTPRGPDVKHEPPAPVVVDSSEVANPPADAEADAEEDRHDAAQASGQAKMLKLGLTQAEVFAMFGVEDPAVKAARKKERRDGRATKKPAVTIKKKA